MSEWPFVIIGIGLVVYCVKKVLDTLGEARDE